MNKFIPLCASFEEKLDCSNIALGFFVSLKKSCDTHMSILHPANLCQSLLSQTAKSHIIETGDSRHNRDQLRDPSETFQYDSAVMFGGFQGAPIMPRDFSLSDSCKPDRCFFQSGQAGDSLAANVPRSFPFKLFIRTCL